MVQGIDSAPEHTPPGKRARRVPRNRVLVGITALVVPLALLAATISHVGVAAPGVQASSPQPDTYNSVADMRADRPFYVAHRGGSADWPEMSMTAYANSAAWGMGALEVSVARTSDGVFFGLHDATLDRTSKVSGSIDPTNLTWAQLTANYKNKLNASSPQGEDYTPVADVFAAFAATHVIFVDTKYIGDTQQRTDLINLMLSYAPASHWVLKGYYTDTALTDLAQRAGIQTWGYYYARDLSRVDSTAQKWDMLGLELGAPAADWSRIKAKGKPVIAFFVADTPDLDEALAKGADGMMTSSVSGVLGVPRTEAGGGQPPTAGAPPAQPPPALLPAAGVGGSIARPIVTRCRIFKPVVRKKKVNVRICIRGSWTRAKVKKARNQAVKLARAKVTSRGR